LDAGATVTVIAAEDSETFELTPAEEAALLSSVAEADHGDLLDASDMIAELSPKD
jgi:hypothetical protein